MHLDFINKLANLQRFLVLQETPSRAVRICTPYCVALDIGLKDFETLEF